MAYDDDWYLHPKLKPILSNTYGVIIYQEQVLAIARDLCGYTLGQADMLRRAIGKKKPEEMAKIGPEFIRRGIDNGIPTETMDELWSQIVTFANYSFNMGHSAAYGYIAYQTAYLKAHYPIEYMVALINSVINNKERVAKYVKECGELGIPVYQPDVNLSEKQCKHEGVGIRLGLFCINGVGDNLPDYERPVKSFADFMYKNINVNRGAIESMVRAGCFGDDIGLFLAQLDWFKDKKNGYGRILECDEKIKEYVLKGKQTMVDQWRQKKYAVMKLEEVIPLSVDEIDAQQEVLGFTFEEKLKYYDLSMINYTSLLGGECIKFKKHIDKNKNTMAFVMIRTPRGEVELVMFASSYQEMTVGKVYLVSVIGGNKIRDIALAKRIQPIPF